MGVTEHNSSCGCFSVIMLKLTASTAADYCYFDISESIFVHLQGLELSLNIMDPI